MGTVFLTGIVISAQQPATSAAWYFAISAAIPILVALAGFEFHTVTDRQVAQGLQPQAAIRWVLTKEIATGLVAALAAAALFTHLGIPPLVTVSATAAMIMTVVSQEYFRVLVALGKSSAANTMTLLRVGLPGALLLPVWFVTTATHVLAGYFGLISVFSLLAMGYAHRVIAAAPAPEKTSSTVQSDNSMSVAGRYLLVAFTARVLISGDVLLAANRFDAEIVADYGLANALFQAAFTFVDIAVIQWRFRSAVQDASAQKSGRKFLIELAVVGVVVALGIAGVGAVLQLLNIGNGNIALFSAAAGAATLPATLVAGVQLRRYATKDDSAILISYVIAAVALCGAVTGALLAGSPVLLLASKGVAYLVLLTCLRFVLSTTQD